MTFRHHFRHARNALTILFVSVMIIDALPSCHLAHAKAKAALDPALDKSGLWQGTWNLFAPDVDKMNTCVTAEFLAASGRTYQWRSPDPAQMGPWAKFWNFRWLEYYDSIRNNSNQAAWPDLVDWLSRQPAIVPSDDEIVSVRLSRSWSYVSLDTLKNPEKYPYRERYEFYKKDYIDVD